MTNTTQWDHFSIMDSAVQPPESAARNAIKTNIELQKTIDDYQRQNNQAWCDLSDVLSESVDVNTCSISDISKLATDEIKRLRGAVQNLTKIIKINERAEPDLESTSLEDLINAVQSFVGIDQNICIARDNIAVKALDMSFDCKRDQVHEVLEYTDKLRTLAELPF